MIRSLLGVLVVAIAATLTLVPLRTFDLLPRLENVLYDFQFRRRGTVPPSDEIVIIGLDEKTLNELREPLATYVAKHAVVIRGVAAAGAKVIALDILMERQYEALEDDEADLVAALMFASSVGVKFIPASENITKIGAQPLPLRRDWFVLMEHLELSDALVNLSNDSDATSRRQTIEDADGTPSFALAAYAAARDLTIADALPPDWARLPDGSIYINFVGPAGTIRRYSYITVLDATPEQRATWFKDKIVLIGPDFNHGEDTWATPFASPSYFNPRLQRPWMPGVEIHANTLDTLLRSRYLRPPGFALRWLWPFFLAMVVALGCSRSVRWGVGSFAGAILVHSAIVVTLGHGRSDFVIPVLAPVLTTLLAFGVGAWIRAGAARRRRRDLQELFGFFVPSDIVTELEGASGDLDALVNDRMITVMFSDIRGFTSLSEGKPPAEVLDWLNGYLTAMTRPIRASGGTVNDLAGDGIMALFGAPLVAEADGALGGTIAALAMATALDQHNEERARLGRPPLKIGIGVHTGPAIVGPMGSPDHMEYTAIGDTVNLASRIETETKRVFKQTENAISSCVLISQETLKRLPEDLVKGLQIEGLGAITVRGRQEAVDLHWVRTRE